MRLEDIPGGGIRALAPAKVNLYLEVLGLRPDGYHEIDSILQEVTLHDELEFRPRASGGIRLEVKWAGGGTSSLSGGEDNLVVRAARLLEAEAGGVRGGLEIALRKRIPLGAGLGGGSSDAAATLLGLSKLLGLPLSREELASMAARLGSDVPFFIYGGTARCRGRGERVTPMPFPEGGDPFHYVLAYPSIAVSTPLIYKELDRDPECRAGLTSPTPLDTMTPASVWKALRKGDLLFNRLQVVACRAFPELDSFLKEIEREPFIATSMSGSGSTVFGLCTSRWEAERAAARLEGRIRGQVFAVRTDLRGAEWA